MILVIGGRSKIVRALIDELVTRWETVRALMRSSEAAALSIARDRPSVSSDLRACAVCRLRVVSNHSRFIHYP